MFFLERLCPCPAGRRAPRAPWVLPCHPEKLQSAPFLSDFTPVEPELEWFEINERRVLCNSQARVCSTRSRSCKVHRIHTPKGKAGPRSWETSHFMFFQWDSKAGLQCKGHGERRLERGQEKQNHCLVLAFVKRQEKLNHCSVLTSVSSSLPPQPLPPSPLFPVHPSPSQHPQLLPPTWSVLPVLPPDFSTHKTPPGRGFLPLTQQHTQEWRLCQDSSEGSCSSLDLEENRHKQLPQLPAVHGPVFTSIVLLWAGRDFIRSLTHQTVQRQCCG